MTRPRPLGDTRHHLTLLRSMAAQTAADTLLAYEDGSLTPEAWAGAVTRCRKCAWAEGCQKWLAKDEERPRAVPAGCANATLLRGLQLPA